MRRTLLRLLTAVQLTRLTMAFGAVSDVWLVVLITRSIGVSTLPVATLPLSIALSAAAIVAIGLFAFGASLNDLLDVRHDSAFSPERPLPAGRIRAGQAVVVTVGSLLAAVVAASILGQSALMMTTVVAGGILFYNAAGKHVPAVAFLTVAAVHALHMAIPNSEIAFTLPVALVAAHAFAIAALVHRLEGKRPTTSRRSIIGAGLGFAALIAIIIAIGMARTGRSLPLPDAVHPLELGWPLLAIAAFGVIAWRKTTGVPGRIGAEKIRRYGAMWQSLYAVAWLVAFGLHGAAIAIGIMAACGFLVMTALRELSGAGAHQLAYRA